MIEVKECTGKYGCNEVLPLSDFTTVKDTKTGRHGTCKKCMNSHNKNYLKENPEVKDKQIAAIRNWEATNPDRKKANVKAWQEANPDKVKAAKARFLKKNPGYVEPCAEAGYNMGHVVYVVRNYDGVGNDYVGQTKNLYKRTIAHKSLGKLNTESAEVLHNCESREENVRKEAALHAQGYHGRNKYDGEL